MKYCSITKKYTFYHLSSSKDKSNKIFGKRCNFAEKLSQNR